MLNNVDIVIFHSPCFDGGAGAWVVKKWCEENKKPEPYFYGTKPGLSEYKFPDVTGKSVVVIDICFDRDTISSMHEKAAEFVVLDHHKTSRDNMEGLPYAHFDMHRSGCQMAWDYFFPNQDRPTFINNIADRDIWTWVDPLSRPFNAALFNRYGFMNQEETIAAIDKISKFTRQEYDDFVQYGRNCQEFEEKQVNDALRHAIRCNLHMPNGDTIPVWTANARLHRSEIGSRLSKRDDGRFALLYSYDLKSNEWWISLRSDSDRDEEKIVDVGEISKAFPKGGGHACAAGFTWTRHINELISVIRPEE